MLYNIIRVQYLLSIAKSNQITIYIYHIFLFVRLTAQH